jgi:lysophospholipase L1-like esterase
MRSISSTRSPSTEAGAVAAGRRRLLAAVASATLLIACGRKPARPAMIPSGATVLALGDSLTWGTGAGTAESYPLQLARLTGWKVINAGVPAITSSEARERLPGLLAEHAPALVLLSIGGNDFLRRLPEADTRAAIGTMLAEIRASGAAAVLIAVPRPTIAGALLRSLDDHPLYETLATEHGVPLFASAWAKVLSDPALKADQIHANAAGYERFAQELHGFLRESGLASR